MQTKTVIPSMQDDQVHSQPSLRLQRETIQELHRQDLEIVAGGGSQGAQARIVDPRDLP
jgi:hypothetical protein